MRLADDDVSVCRQPIKLLFSLFSANKFTKWKTGFTGMRKNLFPFDHKITWNSIFVNNTSFDQSLKVVDVILLSKKVELKKF